MSKMQDALVKESLVGTLCQTLMSPCVGVGLEVKN